jgi:hypothetical protein
MEEIEELKSLLKSAAEEAKKWEPWEKVQEPEIGQSYKDWIRSKQEGKRDGIET